MNAYYNEIDPYCVEWLRNLIRDGLIAPGDVDDRSINEINASDLDGYDQCHFFAGLGGWSYALRLAGWPDDRPVWTGSCPCQPFSAAGKQKGFSDERHLWPAWLHLIEQRAPAVIFGEQVASATQWIRLVRGDLEALDYAVGAVTIEAASAGADHLRDRFWFVAHGSGLERRGPGLCEGRALDHGDGLAGRRGLVDLGVSEQSGLEGHAGAVPEAPGRTSSPRPAAEAGGECETLDDSAGSRPHAGEGRSVPALGDQARSGEPERRGGDSMADSYRGMRVGGAVLEERQPQGGDASDRRGSLDMADADERPIGKFGRELSGDEGQHEERTEEGDHRSRRHGEGMADADRCGQQGERQQDESEGPLGDEPFGFDWAVGADGKSRRIKPGIRLLAHGVPCRVAKLSAFGNAIVPQTAAEFIGAYLDGL